MSVWDLRQWAEKRIPVRMLLIFVAIALLGVMAGYLYGKDMK